jgi:hypothetical protein
MTDATAVCVLGMHRSGTSLLTGMLKHLGVGLGVDEHQMPPTANNPRGYNENQRIVDLNDEILARFGGSWSSPPHITSDALAQPALSDLRRAARQILAREFGDASLWGWKDPRACLLVPFWELLVPSPRYVICLRNPADVARSLARSDGITRGIELWLRYTSDSFVYTLGKPRLVVFYDDVLRDWREELARLAAFIDAGPALAPAAQAVAADGLVDTGLRHHAERLADTLDDPRVPLAAKALYVALRLAHRPGEALPHGALEALGVAALGAPVPAETDVGSLTFVPESHPGVGLG